MIKRLNFPGSALAILMVAGNLPLTLHAEETANIVANGDFETEAQSPGWPDFWSRPKEGATWEADDGKHFIRLTSPTPGSTVMLYREIPIPAGTGFLEMTWRQRVSNLKTGTQAWFDARIMMEFMNAERAKVTPAPSAPCVRKDTGGWEEKSTRFPVPEGATMLKIMPALFQVETGTFDLDDIVIKAVPAAPAEPATEP